MGLFKAFTVWGVLFGVVTGWELHTGSVINLRILYGEGY